MLFIRNIYNITITLIMALLLNWFTEKHLIVYFFVKLIFYLFNLFFNYTDNLIFFEGEESISIKKSNDYFVLEKSNSNKSEENNTNLSPAPEPDKIKMYIAKKNFMERVDNAVNEYFYTHKDTESLTPKERENYIGKFLDQFKKIKGCTVKEASEVFPKELKDSFSKEYNNTYSSQFEQTVPLNLEDFKITKEDNKTKILNWLNKT